MIFFKKLADNPMKKNSSSSKGVQVLAQHISIYVSKTRRVIDQIHGRSYEETIMILSFMPYQASYPIFKLVYFISFLFYFILFLFRLCCNDNCTCNRN
jgi:hypothetical protein